jgi:hypothetical protein
LSVCLPPGPSTGRGGGVPASVNRPDSVSSVSPSSLEKKVYPPVGTDKPEMF